MSWKRTIRFGGRTQVALLLLLLGGFCLWRLPLDPERMFPSAAGWSATVEFFAAAASPALDYETPPPAGAAPLLMKVALAAWRTFAFAAAAVSLALPLGAALAFCASSAWWREEESLGGRAWRIAARRIVIAASRGLIALMRSVHELIWAVLFLSALGLNDVTAVVAIAIPYAGVFAKIFSEIIDETPRDAADALRTLGGPPAAVFWVGLLPRALPDMLAYACYRLECGMRSSAVMGFFGVTTLGYYLQPAFDEQHYREVWTYLYALLTLVIAADVWSGWMRRRLMS